MRKAAAFAVAFLGLALMLGSCVPGGLSVYRTFAVGPALSVPMATDATHRTATAKLTPGTEAQVAFAMRIETPSVQQEGRAAGAKYQPRYRIPFAYRVRDASGAALADQDGAIDWEASVFKVTRDETTASTGATLTVEHRLARFAVPEDGAVFIEAWLEPDTQYLARAEDARLLLYDAQLSDRWPAVAWVAMLAGGFLMALVGFTVAIGSMASPAAVPGSAGAAPEAAVLTQAQRTHAAVCHAAGFFGYLVPLGHLIGPLAFWLAWRNEDAFTDAQGREALNFQLSMTLYMAVSVVLVILLIGILMLLVLAVAHVALMLVATVAAASGKAFRYPLTIRFIR